MCVCVCVHCFESSSQEKRETNDTIKIERKRKKERIIVDVSGNTLQLKRGKYERSICGLNVRTWCRRNKWHNQM